MRYLGLLLYMLLPLSLLSQLEGQVTNSKGEALAYASIYVEGSSLGTSSNLQGMYSFKLVPGKYQIVFQYVGYETQIQQVEISSGSKQRLDVALKEESFRLDEVVVSADAEDPAYRVIREAIKKREDYLHQIKSYRAKSYIKGLIKMLDAPEKFMGFDIGNMEGILDSNRQGILYLSESESIVYFNAPDQYKEEMISSKVSGDDQGFSFNQATAVDFNFYKNTERFGRKLISPIAASAMRFYRYKLLGVTLDTEGRLVNKIQVIPKRENDPVYFGTLYVTEDLWNIQQLDLGFTSKSVNEIFFDTIRIQQVHIPVGKNGEWAMFSQVLEFGGKLFAFKFGGSFTYIFSEYELNPQITKDVFTNEFMKIQEGANKRDSSYWAGIRPVPLTQEEFHDYERKDSLQVLWDSREYRDSVDRENNKFKFINLIFGYRYNQSFHHRYFEYNAPISSYQFNPVQGSRLSMDLEFRQNFEEERRFFSINSELSYGFSDDVFRPNLTFNWVPENIHASRIKFGIGRQVRQLNSRHPVWENLNTWTSLFGKNNLLKLYDKKYIDISYRRELWNGFMITADLSYEQRSPLQNTTNYSFSFKNRHYRSNVPDHFYFEENLFSKHEAFVIRLQADIFFKQKYISYPKQRFRMGSKYPKIRISYQKALKTLGSDIDYDKLSVKFYDRRLELGRLGYFAFEAELGWMIRDEDISFVDFFHFLGNELHVTGELNHREGFLKLPNYQYSTSGSYWSLVVEHHLEGILLDRIPVIKNWSWESVLGVRYLYQGNYNRYLEISTGIDKINIGPFNLFRFDYVWNFQNGSLWEHGPVFTLSQVLTGILD